ncbi:MAG: hypothetical protein WB784_05510 [Rhodanobacteraceae bacterium]
MTEVERITLTSSLTILGGVIVFVVGQLILKLVIDPVLELRKAISEVGYNLLFYAPEIQTPISRTPVTSEKAREALRKSSSDLYVRCEAIRYRFVYRMPFLRLPNREKVLDAAKRLRGLSNYVHETGEKANGHIDHVVCILKCIERDLQLPPVD